MKGYAKLLITVTDSMGPLEEGIRLAQEENYWVTVLKVLPPYDGDLDLTGVRNISELVDGNHGREIHSLRQAVGEDVPLARVRVERGDISETINRVAQEEECSLIVMGAKKGGGLLRRLIDGNQVSKVASGAPCPVMVVDN